MIRFTMMALLATLMLPPSSFGQGQTINLAWQLPVGRKFDVALTQTVDMKQTVGEQELGREMVSTNYMLWSVDKVDDAGVATVNSEIQRMTMSGEGPQGEFDIDTASQEEPKGNAGQVAEQVTELIGKGFSLEMNAQSKVLSVEMLGGSESENPMMSKEALSQPIINALPVFPDKPVAIGETWQHQLEAAMPGGVGGMKIDATYTYKGTEEADGKTLDLIEIEMELDFQAPKELPFKIEVTRQDSKGQMHFDSANGHPHKVELEQNMEMVVTAGPQTINQSIRLRTEGNFSIKQ